MPRKILALLLALWSPIAFAQTTPTALQGVINSIPYQNGVRGLSGGMLQNEAQTVHDLINGMGSWDANGNYTPSLTGAGVIPALAPNFVPHVPNLAALKTWPIINLPVYRDGYANANDFGGAKYNHVSVPCTQHAGAGDGGSCVPDFLGTGSWLIDYSTTPKAAANPCLFENCATATDDSAAIAAAVATNRGSVYLPDMHIFNRSYIVTSDIVQTLSDQHIFGDGRDNTVIVVPSNANFTHGVLSSSAVEPGPTFSDFSIWFAQNAGSPASMANITHYVPAIYLPGVPRPTLSRLGLYNCWVCVSAPGNSGGAYLYQLKMSAWYHGVELDGEADTVRVDDMQWFPFPNGQNGPGDSALLQLVPGTTGAPNQWALWVGRVDHLIINGGLFALGSALNVHAPANAGDPPATVQIQGGTRFDSYPGVTLTTGTVDVGNVFASAYPASVVSYINAGGSLNIHGGEILIASTGSNAGSTTLPATGGQGVATSGGDTSIVGVHFDMGNADNSAIVGIGGHTTATSNVFSRTTTVTYGNCLVNFTNGADFVFEANRASNLSTSGSRFVCIQTDVGTNRGIGNVSSGYAPWQPSSPVGLYGMNY